MTGKNVAIGIFFFAFGWGLAWSAGNGAVLVFNNASKGIDLRHNADMTASLMSSLFALTDSGRKNYADDSDTSTTKTDDNIISITVVGDMMFDRNIRRLGEMNGYDSLIASLSPQFHSSDIAIANLEGPITDNQSKTLLDDNTMTDSFSFTFDPKVATALADAGVTSVSLANNHSANFGSAGLASTRQYLRDAGIGYFGSPANASSSEQIVCKKGACIALVGYHEFASGFDNVVGRIKYLHNQGYFVIVMPHWGIEYEAKPTAKMIGIAKTFADAGADAIVGSHPHVIGQNEWLGDVPVYYSLGNALFDQYFSPETKRGEMIKLYLTVRNGKAILDHIENYFIDSDPRIGAVLE